VEEEKSRWPARGGLLVAIAVAIGAGLWLLPDAIRQHASELHAGSYTGIATMLAERLAAIVGIVFLGLYVLVLRGWGLDRSLTYLAIIALIAAGADAAIVYATKTAGHERTFQYGQVVADLRNAVPRLDSEAYTPEQLRARETSNDPRVVAKIGQDEAARINRLRFSYQSEISALGLGHALSPRALAEDGGTEVSRERIAQARALIKQHRDDEQKIFADTRLIVRRAQVDDSVRRQMLKAFDRSLSQRSTSSKSMWDCEDRILAEVDLLVQDLAHSRSHWRAQGNMFLFTSRRDLNTFNAHVTNIRLIAMNERQLELETGDTIVTAYQFPGAE
jgi:hypothetical protein